MIDGGSAPGNAASSFWLNPTLQYLATAQTQARPVNGTIDIGAYEAASTSSTTTTSPTTSSTTTTTTSPTFGTRQVQYGANGSYVYQSLTGPVTCNNTTFGDPAFGYAKTCAYADSTSTSTAPTTTSTTSGSGTWTICASEWGTCTFSGTALVRYGANGSYYYQTATGSIGCNNLVFGDPAVGYSKSCSYAPLTSTTSSTSSTTSTTTLSAITVTPTTTWVSCASENGYCSFSGTHQVRYGANGSYYYQTFTGGAACNNTTFGDPAVGVYKSCDYAM